MSRPFKTLLTRSVGVAALAASLTFGVADAAQAAPAIDRNWPAPTPNAESDPFYTPPATIPAGDSGDIIRARPAKAGPPTARGLAQAWQVMYLSTDALGRRDVVTGTILVPRNADPAKMNVVGFGPGTTGNAFSCTVSRYINNGAFYEQAGLNRFLKAGYAVAVTDYEGYYENAQPTYIAGRSMGAAMIDAVRAATRLPEAKLSPSPKVAFHGFSQGGGASMWAGQMAKTYGSDLNLVGVSGGGVPANLAATANELEQSAAFGFLIMAMIGLDNAYSELDLNSFLTESAKPVFANSAANDCTIELISDYPGKSYADYTTSSPFGTAKWLDRAYENMLGLDDIKVPVFQYHAENDPIVPFWQADDLRFMYCKLGMTLQWKVMNTGHVTTVARGVPDAVSFINDRMAGKPPVNSCQAGT